MSISKLDYCQYLLSSPVNYTLTNMADHMEELSHDTINRYLRGEKLTARLLCLLWENVREVYQPHARGYLLFDDTVLDKSFGPSIETTRRQWSGNTHSIVRGIGLVSCVYLNPEAGLFWVVDYRIFDTLVSTLVPTLVPTLVSTLVPTRNCSTARSRATVKWTTGAARCLTAR